MNVEITEFLRRLTAKVRNHKKRRQICVITPNYAELTIKEVVDDQIIYSFGSSSGTHVWVPKVPHYVDRIDFERLNQLSKEPKLLRPKTRAIIHIKPREATS